MCIRDRIYTEDGDMQDIYAGDFLVVGLTEDDFGSLTSEQMQKFEEQFHQPQMFVRMGRSIMAIPVPVSYTHLDVYKRQLLHRALAHSLKTRMGRGSIFFARNPARQI